MEKVLSSIVLTSKKNTKQLEEQTKLLQKIYDVEKEKLKVDQRRAQQEKRAKADRDPLSFMKKEAKDGKKKGGFLSNLFKTIAGLFTGLGAVGLLKALGLTGLGAAIAGLFSNKELRDKIGNALFGDKGLFGKENRDKLNEKLFGKKGLFGEENRKKMMEDLFGKKGLFGKENRDKAEEYLIGKDGIFGEKNRRTALKGIEDFFTKDAPWKESFRKGIVDFFDPNNKWYVEYRNGIKDIFTTVKNIAVDIFSKVGGKASDTTGNFLNNLLTGSEASKGTIKAQDERNKALAEYNKNVGIGTDAETREKYSKDLRDKQEIVRLNVAIDKSLAAIDRFEKSRKETFIDLDGKRKQLFSGAEIDSNIKLERNLIKLRQEKIGTLMGLQSGGFVGTVPGQGGNGDRFKTMLAPGSVVLNQTASNMMQSGGMVPTMLEQGEKVYGPSDPNAGFALMLNSMIPRFQTGGIVSHPDTGTGYQPKGAVDYQGRPVVLSLGGAESWAKMMSASGGKVRGSDVNSSQRSVAKNNAVGGVPNSNHLTGNGVDVQTGSSSWNWMKENSSKYGWNFNNYLGPQGWHWDYTGSNSKSTKKEGKEDGIAQGITQSSNGLMDVVNSMFGSDGKVGGIAFGELISGFIKGLGDIGKLLFSGFSSIGSSILGGQANAGLNGGNMSVPVPGADVSAAHAAKGAMSYKQIVKAAMTAGFNKNAAVTAAAISMGESGRDPTNSTKRSGLYAKTGEDSVGLMQINWGYHKDSGWLQSLGITSRDQLFDPVTNMKAAKYLYDGRGGTWGDWTVHNKGLHLPHMGAAQAGAQGLQKGGVANMRGTGSYSAAMVQKSQEQFAEKIAQAVTPMVVPVPMGGGGASGTQVIPQPGSQTAFPDLPSEDSSIVAMEYKYRITMGASV